MLHDLGLAVGYSGHGGHSQYLVCEAGPAGFSPAEVERIGPIARLQHKSSAVDRSALVVRIARQLDGGITAARIEKNALRLEGDDTLAR